MDFCCLPKGSVILLEGVESGKKWGTYQGIDVFGWDIKQCREKLLVSSRISAIARDILFEQEELLAPVQWKKEIIKRFDGPIHPMERSQIEEYAWELQKFDREHPIRQGSRWWMRMQRIQIETERLQLTLYRGEVKWFSLRLQSMIETIEIMRTRIPHGVVIVVMTQLKGISRSLKNYPVILIRGERLKSVLSTM